jgi:hypothetical protein
MRLGQGAAAMLAGARVLFTIAVVSRLMWKREKAHSSGEMYTTHRPSCRTASGGTRHGQA